MAVPYLIGTAEAGSGTTVTITAATATLAGDTIVVGASASATATVSKVTDSAGNTYTEQNSSTAQNPSSIWAAQGTTAALPAGLSVTVTWNSSTGSKSAAAVGCSGLLKTVDQNPAAAASSGSTTPTITSGTLSAANETAVTLAVWGFAGGDGITWAAGWTPFFTPPIGGSGGQWASMAWTQTTTTSALTASGTISSARWCMFLLTFIDAAIPAVINQWSLTAGQSYGLQAVQVSATAGNTLVAFVGWESASSSAVSPVSNIADDANNKWVHLGTSPVSGLSRCSIWIAPSTHPGPAPTGGASVVSVGLSWYTSGVAVLVAEFAGMPQYAVTDFENSSIVSSTSATLSGTATVPDIVFGLITGNDSALALTPPGGAWQALDQIVYTGMAPASNGDGVVLTPAWQPVSAGTVSGTWLSFTSQTMSGVICGLRAEPPAPVQPNPAFPMLKTEVAFGYQPGNPQNMPAWTDVSSYAIGPSGNAVISTKRGRSYELTQPETGELKILLNNSTGAFTPANQASPFWPDIALELAAKVTAWWDGFYYPVAMGYTERLPQSWPDLPQYGFTPLTATDGIGVLANSALPSALAGDYLLDSPYVYIPCSEEYATGTTVSNEVYGAANSGAAGLNLANLSRTNTRAAVAFNGVARLGTYPNGSGLAYYFLETGLSLGLASAVANSPTGIIGAPLLTGILGDPGGGIGISTLPTSSAGLPGWTTSGLFCAPGARYIDPGLPQAGTAEGYTAEFWAILPTGVPAGFTQNLLRLEGASSPYFYFVTPSRLLVQYSGGHVQVYVSDYAGNNDLVINYTVALQDGLPHFYSVVVIGESVSYAVTLYIDGVSVASATSTGVTVMTDIATLSIGPVMSSKGATWFSWNYTIGHVAVFPQILPASRIAAHYASGYAANSGDSGPERAARILAWSGFGLARACDLGSPSPVFGPADQIQGQTASSALYAVAQDDNGMLYCDAAGNVTIRSRAALYNRPVKWYFGDAPVPAGALNANSTFASGTSPWTASNGAILSQNTAWSHDGTASLQITGNGSTAGPGALSELTAAVAGVTYMVNAWVYSPQGWSQVQAGINWYNASQSYLGSSAGIVLNLQPQAPTLLPQVTATAPASAAYGQIYVQMLGTPPSSVQLLAEPVILACAEVPYLKPSGFDYDNSFLWNLLTARQQESSAYNGSSATAISIPSQQAYFTRGGSSAQINQTLETLSFQDVLDDVNWGLARYGQPQIRTQALIVDAYAEGGNLAVWPTVLGIEQGDVCSMIRRPVGGAVISELGIVQKVQHDIGPERWVTSVLIVPYAPANNVLTSDYNPAAGNGAIPW